MTTLVTFEAGEAGDWRIEQTAAVTGEPLPAAAFLSMHEAAAAAGTAWTLRGAVSNLRYTTAAEAAALRVRQDGLGRAEATCAALIPIRKSPEWWALAQDERRAIIEDRSHHIALGLDYLPAIARRLHHCRDIGGCEPFDFLTWFEYAPEHAAAFGELTARLRATEEWRYVEREVDIRLTRA